jgi:hypothetical protein
MEWMLQEKEIFTKNFLPLLQTTVPDTHKESDVSKTTNVTILQ